jgi:transposase-like protein
LTSIDSIRQEIHAEKPKVAITDFEEGLRSSIQETWPDTQLQLCIFHINQNITSNAKKKWQGAGGPPPDEFDVARDKEAAEAEALNNQARIDEVLSRGQLPEEAVDHTVSGFCSLWAYVEAPNS